MVGEFSSPLIAGRGRINIQTLFPGEENSGLPDGIVYGSPDSSTHVLVTTPGLIRSWIAREFDRDTVVPRDPRSALGTEDVLTQLFDVDAHVFAYTEIPVDNAIRGLISAKLVTRSQDYDPSPADELMISVERGHRIFIIDTPARDTLAVPATCCAIADSEWSRSKSVLDDGYIGFRQCYGETVAREARFHALVAQVRQLIEALPDR